MIATESMADFSRQPTLPAVAKLAIGQMRELLEATAEFRQWTRERLILREPNAAELYQHNHVCRFFIRMLGLLQTVLNEPDFPDKSLANDVAFAIHRLTEDWEMLHNAMPEDEAKKLIPELFTA